MHKKATKKQLQEIQEAELHDRFCSEARYIHVGGRYHIRVGTKNLKHGDTMELFKMFKREVKRRNKK